MIPVLTPDQVRSVDAAAPEPVEVLIERAGAAVFRAALDLLGGTYGRRVTVLAGPGNNGADGRSAARRLEARGVRVQVIDVGRNAGPIPDEFADVDLVIDAAFGTGFRGTFVAPTCGSIPVLAVDIPSGVNAENGTVGEGSRPLAAVRTVTFQCCKPGLLFGAGAALAGEIEIADIGLDLRPASPLTVLLEEADVRARWPQRRRDAHKWNSGLLIVGGSAQMPGAPVLCAQGALRAGAGMVRLGVPGTSGAQPNVIEAVGIGLPADGWASAAIGHAERCRAAIVGPGLGTGRSAKTGVRAMLAVRAPLVLDADGLSALAAAPVESNDSTGRRIAEAVFSGPSGRPPTSVMADPASLPGQRAVEQAKARRLGRPLPAAPNTQAARAAASGDIDALARTLAARASLATILTPHDGEFAALTGYRPDPDRIADARRLATSTGSIVLLKGPCTVVAAPDGRVELVNSGDARLATAGTGDVLAGVLGALLAQGLSAFEAASAAAFAHGAAAQKGYSYGLLAGDLPSLIAAWCSER